MAYDAFISYSHAADGRLAPALQSGLQRLAKPWYRLRALRVFRDETGLATNPYLWGSIVAALDASEWFVLLASPESAASPWVEREISHWLETTSAERILSVVTGGEWDWDAAAGHLVGSAVPEVLRAALTEEPRHLDLRWTADETDLNVRNSGFRSAVADLAAPMHGVAKDELEGEDIRQHRRARRLARGGVAVLAVLVVVAAIAGGLAVSNAGRAERNADRAEREASVARARGLAGQAVARANSAPDLALLLALEGNRADDSVESRSALLTVLQRTANVKRLLNASAGEVVAGLSEDGRIVASSDLAGAVHLVAFASRRTSLSFVTHQRGPVSVFFSPDGRLVATTSEDATVRLWDEKGRPASPTLREHSAPVRVAAFSPDGKRLITEDSAGFSFLWDTATGQLRARMPRVLLTPHIDVVFGANGTRVAYSGIPTRVFDISAGTTVIERTFHGPLSSGNVALSADGTLLATGSPGAVEVWDVASDQLRVVLHVATFTGALRFSPDGSTLAIGQGDGATTLWDISTGQMIGTPLIGLRGAVTRLAFDVDGNLVTASASGAAIWELKRSALNRATKISPLLQGNVVLPAVAFSTDGRQVATFDGQLAFFDPSTVQRRGALIPTVSTGTFVLGDLSFPGLAFSARGHAYAAAGTAVSDIDTRSRRVSRAALRISRQATDLDLSADGRLLAIGDRGGTVTLVDVAHWSIQRRAKLHVVNSAVVVALSPDSRLAVSGGDDGRVVLQNTRDGSVVTLAEGKGPILGVDFSPDGKLIAAGFGDGRVLIIDVERRAPVGAPLVGQGGSSPNVVFSPDGRLLAVTTEDGVIVWDVDTQQRIGKFDNPNGTGSTEAAGAARIAFDAAFSPDNKQLATTAGDDSLVVWTLDLAEWTRRACEVAGRNLTRAEWRQNIGEQPYHHTCTQWG